MLGDLVDEVMDHGDHLTIRRGGKQAVVAFSDITAIDQERWPGITLHLQTEGIFGSRVRFLPASTREDRYGGKIYDTLATRLRAGTLHGV